MNRDDWLVGIAASLGILGVAIGWWWADAVAAIVISLSVCRDGLRDLVESVRDLMDSAPTSVDHRDEGDVGRRLEAEVAAIPWVASANARLRENGRLLVGEIEVVPREGMPTFAELDEVRARAHAVDWRLHDLYVVPVRR
jgi:divalent metal cation (Fe/Co/Zn/Cd) transporter